MDADLAETVDMLTRAIGIIERELAKSAGRGTELKNAVVHPRKWKR